MTRIFLSLAFVSTTFLTAAFVLGFQADSSDRQDVWIDIHWWTGFGAIVVATLVHAIVLTYFMGTGRWLEDTSHAYQLAPQFKQENQSLKYRTIPLMVLCIALLLVTGAFGAAVDPASPVQFQGWFGISGPTIHMLVAAGAFCVNLLVHWIQYQALFRNGQIIEEVMQQVGRIRRDRGLPV